MLFGLKVYSLYFVTFPVQPCLRPVVPFDTFLCEIHVFISMRLLSVIGLRLLASPSLL